MEKLNLPPFYIGQKVVCISPNKDYPIKEGQVVIIKEVRQNKCCGVWVVNVGISSFNDKMIRCSCNLRYANDNTLSAKRFVPAQEQKFKAVTFEKLCEEVELICEN